MRILQIAVLILIVVFIGLLSFSHFNQVHVKLWDKSQLFSPTVILPDYVLNYSQKIKPPLECVPFSTISGEIPICIHRISETISNSIRNDKIWERAHCKSLQDILVANPDYGVIDIGANLGMFSLLAANLQRPALAVEAMDINIEKFHQSIVVDRFEKYITLVTRPLSDKHETLQLTAAMSNLGYSSIVNNEKPEKESKRPMYKGKIKSTVLLDELINLMPWKKAVLVMDVEGNEGKVLRGGKKFFDAIQINYVFMEWYHLNSEDQKFVLDFFSKRGYKLYDSPFFRTEIDLSTFKGLPQDIFWKKTNDSRNA